MLGVSSVAAVDNTFGDVTNETTGIETDLLSAFNAEETGPVNADSQIHDGDEDGGVLPL